MEGVIWHIYRRQEKGMIRGDDGAQLPFRKTALKGLDFRTLSSGQRVSYRIQDSWLEKEAGEVKLVSVGTRTQEFPQRQDRAVHQLSQQHRTDRPAEIKSFGFSQRGDEWRVY